MNVRPTKGPLRKVDRAVYRQGQSINNNQISMQWWDLYLECGHLEERRVRFPKQEGRRSRGFAALHHPRPRDEALPAQKKARCHDCTRKT